MTPDAFYVVGGRQRPDAFRRHESSRHQEGVILHVEVREAIVSDRVRYRTPPDLRPPEGEESVLFKAGTLVGDRLYVCTQTEILAYHLPSFEPSLHLSLPCFNDVHHVLPIDVDSLLVAVTGLDMVLETTTEGKVTREWGVLGGDPWVHFDRAVDYRRVPTTKPHRAHPNYVFRLGEEVWVTRFKQRDAICLTHDRPRIAIEVGGPHDGIAFEDWLYFTTVDGHVVVVDKLTLRVLHRINLNGIGHGSEPLGWCRGIVVLDRERVVVGFSRLRPTRFLENLAWLQRGLGLAGKWGNLPTRIVAYDLRRRAIEWQIDLEEAGINVVFSIHPAIDPSRA